MSATEKTSHLNIVINQLLSKSNHSILHKQLFFLPANLRPKDLLSSINAANFQPDESTDVVWTVKALKNLNIYDKISVLMRSIGIFETCKLIESTYKGEQTDPHAVDDAVTRVNAFAYEVREFTWNMISHPQLNSLRVLEMLLFAEIAKCSFRLTSDTIKTLDLPSIQNTLVLVFNGILEKDSLLIDSSQLYLDTSINVFKQLREQIESFLKSNPHQSYAAQLKSCKMVEKILDLVLRAMRDPVHLLPILREPIQVQTEITLLQDQKPFSLASISTLLTNFHSSFNFQFDHFYLQFESQKKFMKLNKKIANPIRAALQNLKLKIYGENNEIRKIFEKWYAYQQLPLNQQLRKSHTLAEIAEEISKHAALPEVIKLFDETYANKITPYCESNISDEHPLIEIFDLAVRAPFNNLLYMERAVLQAVAESKNLYETNFSFLDKFLDKRFRVLQQVTGLDLIRWSLNKDWLSLNRSNDENAIKSAAKVHIALNALFNKMQEFIRRSAMGSAQVLLDKEFESLKSAIISSLAAHPEVDYLIKVFDLTKWFKNFLKGQEWRHFLVKSPYEEKGDNSALELEFLGLLFSDLKAGFTISVKIACDDFKMALNREEKTAFISQMTTVYQKIEHILQKVILKASTVAQENLNDSVKLFWDHCLKAQEQIEDMVEILEAQLEFQNTENAKNLLTHLTNIKNVVETYVFIPGTSLFNYCQMQELQKSVSAVRILLAPHIETPYTIFPQIEVPSISSQVLSPLVSSVNQPQFSLFKSALAILNERCRFFEMAPKATQEEIESNFRQHEYCSNLMRNLNSFEELSCIESLHRPSITLETLMRSALLLEQAGKLACTLHKTHPAQPNQQRAFYEMRGKEMDWEGHALLTFAEAVEKACPSVIFDSTEKQTMNYLGRMIGVEYRCSDFHAHELLHSSLLDLRNSALSASLKMVTSVIQEDLSTQTMTEVSSEKLESCLQPFPISTETTIDLQIIKIRVAAIKRLRTLAAYREVQQIGPDETTLMKRVGTMKESLKNLDADLEISRDILEGMIDPALILTLAEALLSREATLLEHLLLFWLAFTPCSVKDSNDHFLWSKKRNKPLRYSHEVVTFANCLREELSTIPESLHFRTEQLAKKVEHYLKQGHRYGENKDTQSILREKFATLSYLRRRLADKTLSAAEEKVLDKFFKASSPSGQLKQLDAYLIKEFQTLQESLKEACRLVDEWLTHFQNTLNQI